MRIFPSHLLEKKESNIIEFENIKYPFDQIFQSAEIFPRKMATRPDTKMATLPAYITLISGKANRVFKFASSDSFDIAPLVVAFPFSLPKMGVNFPHKPRRNDL